MAALLKAGRTVLLPVGENQRYDLVIDADGVFTRIQCKTARITKGCVAFNTCSTHHHRGSGRRSYVGEADFFGVYCPEVDKVYFVPIHGLGNTACWLRLDPPKRKRAATKSAVDFETPP